MERQLLQVMEFQKAFGVNMPESPSMLNEERAALRQIILEEEVAELRDAKDMNEVADALMDILYITYGSIHEYGLADRAVMLFDEVHRSNMSKIGTDSKPLYREDGKIMKPETFSPPNLNLILERDFSMYKKNDVLEEIYKKHEEETRKTIEQKIKSTLNWFDRMLLWISESLEKSLRKRVIVKYPTSSIGNIIVTVYGKDYVVK